MNKKMKLTPDDIKFLQSLVLYEKVYKTKSRKYLDKLYNKLIILYEETSDEHIGGMRNLDTPIHQTKEIGHPRRVADKE